MICKECGKEIEDNSEFCYFCGADFGTGETPTDVTGIVCSVCKGKVSDGTIQVKSASNLFNTDTVVDYVKKEDSKKLVKKDAVSLRLKADGYYCEHCGIYIGIFKSR